MRSRRSYLLAAGTLAVGAGCASLVPSGDRTRSGGPGSSTPTATPVPPPSASVTVADVGVHKAVVYESVLGSSGVLAAADRQYVVASVTTDSEVPASAFTFEAGDDSWEHGHPETAGGVNSSLAGREGVPLEYGGYEPGADAYLAFVVPSPLSASDPCLRYSGPDTRTWPLDEWDRDRLAAPEPRFEVASLTVPDRVTKGEPLEVSLAVRNVSETDGRFLSALYWPTRLVADDDEATVVERWIDAGDRAAVGVSIPTEHTGRENERINLEIEGHVSASQTVRFRTR